jgi:hypothetical protein
MSSNNLPAVPDDLPERPKNLYSELVVKTLPHTTEAVHTEDFVASILNRPDIAPLVKDLSVDPRPIGEPVDRLRTNQAHLVRALSGLQNGADFHTLARNPSSHIQAVLKTLTNNKPDAVTKEIQDALLALDAKNGPQQGQSRGLPSLSSLLKKRGGPNIDKDTALYATEAIQLHKLGSMIRHAIKSGDPEAEKKAVKQAGNYQKVANKMMKENSEGMHKRLKQSKEELDKWLESLNGFAALKDAISGIANAIGNFFRRMSPKGN